MAGLSQYLKRALLNHVFRGSTAGTNFAQPTTLFVGLFPADPTDSGVAATEISGNGYARVAITFAAPAGTGEPGAIVNTTSITFPQATGVGWGTIAYWAVFDAATVGNFLGSAPLTQAKTVGGTDTFSFPASNISLSFN